MNARIDHLLHELLELSAEERSAVAVALLDSLGSDGEAGLTEVWRAELLRRREELHSGRISSVPWEEARARLAAL